MTTRKLPEIAACPCGKSHARLADRPEDKATYVRCPCGWYGPFRSTKRGAILAWNRRASDAEAERRGAMAAVKWLREHTGGYSWASAQIELAIGRGEVLPAKPEPWIVSKPGVMGGKPCVRGTRITVETLQAAAKGWVHWRILKEYPGLTAEGLTAALAYRLPKKGRKRA